MSAPPSPEAVREAKLELIHRLTAEELRGWIWARRIDKRAWFDGERAALLSRARRLGVMVDL